MTRAAPLTSLKQISDINLTPLMDLTFILLITFIITFPLIEQGISVNLPKATANELSPEKAATVTLDEKGNMYLDDFPVSFEQLRTQLTDLRVADPEINVMIRADERLQYGAVVRVLKTLHLAEITRMALVTESEAGPSS